MTALINTVFGERHFEPNIGSPLRSLLFEPVDAITTSVMERAIEYTLRNFEPRVQLDTVSVEPKEDENAYDISIYFSVLGINQPTSVSITLERLR